MHNRFKFFFIAILVIGVITLDHSPLGWPLERPLVAWIAQKVGRPLPQVTAVVLPLNEGVLVPQDVALTLRACGSFHPRMIMVTEPMGDFSNGPFSLIREGMETGSIEGTPFFYDPCFLPHAISLSIGRTHPRVLALDDFLLKREEMERGAIRPELDVFFRNQTVLLGGPNALAQAQALQSEQERQEVHSLNPFFYGLLFVVLSLFLASLLSLDSVLATLLFFLCYGAVLFFLFRWQGIFLPLFLPVGLLLSSRIFRRKK